MQLSILNLQLGTYVRPGVYKNTSSYFTVLRGMQTFLKETLKAMDGFVLVVSPIGEIIYASTNISEHIGLRQVS